MKNHSGWKNIFILPSLFFGIETFAQQKSNDVTFEKQVVFSSSKTFGETEIIQENKNVEAGDSIIVHGIYLPLAPKKLVIPTFLPIIPDIVIYLFIIYFF